MSLNRFEQTVFDYVKAHPDERQYWHDKVRAFVTVSGEHPSAVARIDSELWRYYVERSSVLPSFDLPTGPAGPTRISMKNLAELLVRLWIEPKPKKPPGLDPVPGH